MKIMYGTSTLGRQKFTCNLYLNFNYFSY